MNASKLSDEEVQPLVLQSIRETTREEWQSLVDAAREAFDRQEAAERAYTRIVSHVKPKAISKRSHKTTKVLAG